MFVVIEVIWPGIVGNIQIGPAVIVVISPNHSQTIKVFRIIHSSFLRNVSECSVAVIVKKEVRLAGQSPGPALHKNSLEATVFFVAAEHGNIINVEMNVTGDEKIHFAVAVVVSPSSAGAQAAHSETRFVGDIFK